VTGIDLAPVTHVRRAGDGLIVLVSFASLAATSPRGQAWVTERLCLDNLRITGADAAAIRCTGDFLEGTQDLAVDARTGDLREGPRFLDNWPAGGR
jgi:hypothetical protein